MNEYVTQSRLMGMKPVVANHLNIPKPAANEPMLLTFDEVRRRFTNSDMRFTECFRT